MLDLLTLMGTVGGLYGSLIAIGLVFLSVIARRYFMSRIVARTFQYLSSSARKQENEIGESFTKPKKAMDDRDVD